ncbi:hypothetical protein ARC96_02630 [Escherichia coli]|uniref:Uncharacterized protein n=1 Tax=Salmonella enterica TaxID=28901 RepID=A0A763BR04_SALER|nr:MULTISPECIES: hypothetical protein [Enterobacteriaceae]EBO3310991.1 hypothetical protein [Salmonella enterica subsp. enterica serovar Tennessee]HAG4128888.1 hypothetical protein [Salmonella enterica]HEC7998572.1 hypothetical protein [Salmonella enterica subsp. enterica serovar Mbandaka]ECM5978628.1 hypothetical protein [Salmonella enterica subsp. enterica serovar Tennessee]ECO0280784.1 hypothetical protein [Salmonella enterica subsp. enterica serovar Tennessee]
MKFFSTGFYVSNDVLFDDVFNECFSWIHESPHTNFIPAQLACDYLSEDFYVESSNERIDVITHGNQDVQLGCFRYSKISEPHKWVTDISINKNLINNTVWIQVESSVVSQEAAYLAPQPKKPLIVIRLIDKFSGGLDDAFKTSIEPDYLSNSEEHLKLAAKVINGETENRLPIIYVSSKYFYNEHPHNIIPERLARKVCGIAHVLIEPREKMFSIKLKNETNSKNAYAGAVGIYWPRGQNISFYRRGEKTAKEFEDELFDDVVKATSTMAPVSEGGWSEIQKRRTKDSINTLKIRGEYTSELMGLYEADNVAKDETIEELKSNILSLEYRVRMLQSQASAQGSIVINAGEETDFFNGEIKDVIIEALKVAIVNTKEGSRSNHILSSLISNNPQTMEANSRQTHLKRALNGYRSMDKATSRQLKELGFELSEEGKHWKLVYNGDSRYSYILPKTGSDYRGSLNAISDISNIIF